MSAAAATAAASISRTRSSPTPRRPTRTAPTQTADQDQASPSSPCGCGGGLGIQVLGQKSVNGQAALSASGAFQDFGKSECGCSSGGNSNDPVRVWSPGNDGSVDQSNKAESKADSTNRNSTSQDGDQSQSGSGHRHPGSRPGGRERAARGSTLGCLPARSVELQRRSPGVQPRKRRLGRPVEPRVVEGGCRQHEPHLAGRHRRARPARAAAAAAADPQIQALGQSAGNLQPAFGFSTALQLAPKNANGGAAVWSPGNGGLTRQGNKASSNGDADNRNGAFAAREADAVATTRLPAGSGEPAGSHSLG